VTPLTIALAAVVALLAILVAWKDARERAARLGALGVKRAARLGALGAVRLGALGRRSAPDAAPPDAAPPDGALPAADAWCAEPVTEAWPSHNSYSSADHDPIITGQLYADRDRCVYASRTSLNDVYGLQEYSSSGLPGDVGVDVGPIGLAVGPSGTSSGTLPGTGVVSGADDGIPANWAFPSTPLKWYRPRQRDYYGPAGPTPYSEGVFALTEPDHDPLQN